MRTKLPESLQGRHNPAPAFQCEYHIPDFSNWKDHDSYQQAFQRLVKDLKAEEKKGAAG